MYIIYLEQGSWQAWFQIFIFLIVYKQGKLWTNVCRSRDPLVEISYGQQQQNFFKEIPIHILRIYLKEISHEISQIFMLIIAISLIFTWFCYTEI